MTRDHRVRCTRSCARLKIWLKFLPRVQVEDRKKKRRRLKTRRERKQEKADKLKRERQEKRKKEQEKKRKERDQMEAMLAKWMKTSARAHARGSSGAVAETLGTDRAVGHPRA